MFSFSLFEFHLCDNLRFIVSENLSLVLSRVRFNAHPLKRACLLNELPLAAVSPAFRHPSCITQLSFKAG